MNKILSIALSLCAALAFAAFSHAQTRGGESSLPASVVKGTGKATVIVVGSAANVAWGATKFAGKYILKPAAKTIFLKAVPGIGKFVVRKSIKYILPNAAKYSLL